MKNTLSEINYKLNALSVFRSILETPVVSGLQKLLYAIEKGSLDDQLRCYGAFSSALYEEGGNISEFIRKFIREDENFFLIMTTKKAIISRSIRECLDEELAVLQELAEMETPKLTDLIDYNNYLPHWDTSQVDLKSEYYQMIDAVPTTGYGIFARYRAFKIADGSLVPVKNPDNQTLDRMYGYERERSLVLENTRALALGNGASNVLLYGDAGTGKSSTIKACANYFADQGVRLVEFDKSQLEEIPDVIDMLYDSPLKFIFFIDDLSFSAGDDSFCFLKGILEGNITGNSNNIAIYATSNRRHLVRETAEERQGSDIHLNDTLQQTMSLSARFGLTVTFSKPEKDLYLEIVRKLADEYGIELSDEQLFRKAEAFAIRSSGRSPRTAKQFVQLLRNGL
jgi:predicted AAA+ superfamily ATPase